MNDRIFLGFFLYLLLGSVIMGLLPSEFFTGTRPVPLDVDELTGDLPASPTSVTSQLTFFGKVMRFMFVPIVISGVPMLIGIILELFHLLAFTITVIYAWKVITGGSTA